MSEPAQRKAGSDLDLVAQFLGFGEVLELFERLVLDLADSLARDVELAADLLECVRVLAVGTMKSGCAGWAGAA